MSSVVAQKRRRRSAARKRADAIHESGHAVCAQELGADVRQVDIRWSIAGSRGHCFHGELSSKRKLLAVLWAGFVAELIDYRQYQTPRPTAGKSLGGDHPRAEALIVELLGKRWTRERADRAHYTAQVRAAKLLNANWSAVVDIAGMVMARRRIDGKTVRSAIAMGRMVPRER